MNKEQKQTFRVRVISVGFSVLVLTLFKPFGLGAWRWEAYAHLLAIGLLGISVCMLTEVVLKYLVRMPRSTQLGVDYIIRRNLWFQIINTVLVSLAICLYRHFVLSGRLENNQLSWSNFFETLVIIAFCSFAIGLYWRYKFRSLYLAAELEESRLLNEQLSKSAASSATLQPSASITLTGSTSESVAVSIHNLLYIEAVGNYVKIYQWRNDKVSSDLLRATTKQVEEALKPYPMIVRCHRAFLVNLQQVEQIVSHTGSMQLLIKHSNDSIPVSRSNISAIKEAVKKIG